MESENSEACGFRLTVYDSLFGGIAFIKLWVSSEDNHSSDGLSEWSLLLSGFGFIQSNVCLGDLVNLNCP